MRETDKKYGINSFTLKSIAMISMLVDHVGVIFFPQYVIFRIVGRLAFPIFAYLLVEGFVYTHDVKKYILRIGAFAFVSEIPFDLAFNGRFLEFGHQNVFFTLLLGLILLYLIVRVPNRLEKLGLILLFFLLSEILHTDYNSMGILMILCFFLFRDRLLGKVTAGIVINVFLMGYIQAFGALAMIPISLHNRQQGRKMKFLFYGFYPVHLLVLYIIRIIM